MERFSYDEMKQDIHSDYERYMDGGYKFSFNGATSKILDDFRRVINSNEVESIMIYIVLAQEGIEHGELCPQIRDEVQKIINKSEIARFEEELSSEEYNQINHDLLTIKENLSAE